MDKGKLSNLDIAMALSDSWRNSKGQNKDRIDQQIADEKMLNSIGSAGSAVAGLAGLFSGASGGAFGDLGDDYTPRLRTTFPNAYRGAQYGTVGLATALYPPVGLPLAASNLMKDPAVQRTARDFDGVSLLELIRALSPMTSGRPNGRNSE